MLCNHTQSLYNIRHWKPMWDKFQSIPALLSYQEKNTQQNIKIMAVDRKYFGENGQGECVRKFRDEKENRDEQKKEWMICSEELDREKERKSVSREHISWDWVEEKDEIKWNKRYLWIPRKEMGSLKY